MRVVEIREVTLPIASAIANVATLVIAKWEKAFDAEQAALFFEGKKRV
jgi:hypothetical protein